MILYNMWPCTITFHIIHFQPTSHFVIFNVDICSIHLYYLLWTISVSYRVTLPWSGCNIYICTFIWNLSLFAVPSTVKFLVTHWIVFKLWSHLKAPPFQMRWINLFRLLRADLEDIRIIGCLDKPLLVIQSHKPEPAKEPMHFQRSLLIC